MLQPSLDVISNSAVRRTASQRSMQTERQIKRTFRGHVIQGFVDLLD